MNISFNVNKAKKNEDPIKEQINLFKLKVDETDRYLTSFNIFYDDEIFTCVVEDDEIQVSYKDNKIVDIECYNQETMTKELRETVVKDKSISENLELINGYFFKLDTKSELSYETDDSEEEETNKKQVFKSTFNQSSSTVGSGSNVVSVVQTNTRRRLQKIFETHSDNSSLEDSDEEILKKMNSQDNSDDESLPEDAEDVTRKVELPSVKPVRFDFNVEMKSVIPDLSDDIITTENNDTDNYVPEDIKNNSKKVGTNSTVHQIINEINNAIKKTKDIIIKPIQTIFEILVENKFKETLFSYTINMPLNYPFKPPTISIKSQCNQSLSYALNNCEILNDTKWNPSTSVYDIINGIYTNLSKFDLSDAVVKSTNMDSKFYELSVKLLQITNTEPLNTKSFTLNFDFLKLNDKSNSRGIGYDHTGPVWDHAAYLRDQEQKIINITKLMQQIIPLINSNAEYIKDTCIIPYINQYIYDVSPLEVEKRKDYYTGLFELFNEIYKLNIYNDNFRLNKISEQSKSLAEFPDIVKFISNIEQNIDNTVNKDGEYINTLKEFAYDMIPILGSKRFKFIKEVSTLSGFSQEFGRRVAIEMRNLKLNLTKDVSITSSVFFRQDESNMAVMKFIIIPHPDTPYAYGCFEFDMYLPVNYPNSPPHVEIITTGGGKFRFNPNLYDNGKVCLSLLGTWSGSGGEAWSRESNIYQVLIAIQSVIFCEEPYFNEPGWEKDRNTDKGRIANNNYTEPIRMQTLKLGMVDQLRNPPFGFEDVVRNHFKLQKDNIYKKLDAWCEISTNKGLFVTYYNELKTLISKLET